MSGIEGLGNFDDEQSGPGGAEQLSEAQRAGFAARSQQVAAIRKEEGKARQKDDRVAAVLQRFLGGQGNPRLMLLIARCTAHNIPAGLILGILALVEKEAQEEFEKLMGESVLLLPHGDAATHESTALATAADFDMTRLPPHVKVSIDRWGHGLFEFGLTQPTRLAATAISPAGEIFVPLADLTAEVLKDYLASQNIRAETAETRPFAAVLLKNVLTEIARRLDETKELGSGEEKITKPKTLPTKQGCWLP